MAEALIDEDAYLDASRRGSEERASGPVPVGVRYDAPSGRIVVEFSNDAAFMVPARSLQGLEAASDHALAEVEMLGETGLHWERLDVDFRISSLMAGVFGTAAFMEVSYRRALELTCFAGAAFVVEEESDGSGLSAAT